MVYCIYAFVFFSMFCTHLQCLQGAAKEKSSRKNSKYSNAGFLAENTELFSGAELAGLVRSAASFTLARTVVDGGDGMVCDTSISCLYEKWSSNVSTMFHLPKFYTWKLNSALFRPLCHSHTFPPWCFFCPS